MAMGGKLMAIKTSKGDGKARKKCLAALYRRLQRLEKTQVGGGSIMVKQMIFNVIDGIEMQAYTREDKAQEKYESIVKRRWKDTENGFDDYHRDIDKALLEHYTQINGCTIMMRAMFLEIDKEIEKSPWDV